MEVKIQIPDNCELIKDGDTYIVKEKKQGPPKSWEEFCENYPVGEDECWISDGGIIRRIYATVIGKSRTSKNWITTKEEAEAFLALMQLRQLRKAWVGDWNPSGDNFYAIIFSIETGLKTREYASTYRALSFPTPEMAQEFLDCFKDLCETAKILI